MRLENSFTVGLPPAQAWAVLTDPRRVAPCLPGVHLDEVDGDDVRGGVRVKVGPISAEYSGLAQFRSRDEAAGVVVVAASGREVRGRGSASATVTLRLAPSSEGTRVDLATDLALTGRLAQFGRGVLGEVTGRLVEEFARTLAEEVAGERSGAAGSPAAGSPVAGSSVAPRSGAEPAVGTAGAEVVDLAAEEWPDDEQAPALAAPAAVATAAAPSQAAPIDTAPIDTAPIDTAPTGAASPAPTRAARNADAVVLRAVALPVAKRVVPAVAAVVAAVVLARRLRR
ncbi:SRPBCC family protein [Amycolatopsis rhabdoformis]|uniref:SRPBCC family protein n=1 Tax=Amycolatopsis rhabdoformis TaxID=1448059 RepID=A0ABZ1ID43_9PSEU|nr:SRPBCC family protein [Amycolatopsis rhabdoformis]WSE31971.1 SRPBCC family protein [Amycolatopsis rhabdoformis]